MKSSGGFTGTPSTPLAATGAGPVPVAGPAAAGGPDRNELLLAGIIGEQLSGPIDTIDRVVREFSSTHRITRTHIQSLKDSIELARRISMQSQQVARLAGGRLRQSHERLSLDHIVNHALSERSAAFNRKGLELYRHIKPVDIIVDPGLLSSLVDTAIDWAAERCQRLTVSLDIKNWPEHGMLVLKANQAITSAPAPDSSAPAPQDLEVNDGISWYLLVQTAQAMGVTVNRVIAHDEITLTIEFARTVKQLEGLSAVEVDVGGDSSIYSDSKPMAGHRVLLVTVDEAVRGQVKQVCRSMGLQLEVVPSSLQAERICEMDKPHMIVIDERVRDARFEALWEDLRRFDSNLPFIEITNAADTLEMASWVSGSMARVGRGSLAAHLPSILVFELAKVI